MTRFKCFFTHRGPALGGIGSELIENRLQQLRERKQGLGADLRLLGDAMLCCRWADHPGGNLQGYTRRIDHGQRSVATGRLAEHIELLSPEGMKRVVDRYSRTDGFMTGAASIPISTPW
jgi:hypothetical protein